MDLRLVHLVKRTFRVVPSVRRMVLLDQIRQVLGCSAGEAAAQLDDLVQSQHVVVRGYGSGTLVFPGPSIDSDVLRAAGVEVPRGF